MIFIGPEFSDPHAHFVTNIISSIGTDKDLIIDLYQANRWETIRDIISAHLDTHDESCVVYNAYEDEDFFIHLKHEFPQLKLITVFSDDEWRHANYDRYLALYSNISAITDVGHYDRYAKYRIPAVYMPWACNPEMFYPVEGQKKDIDVSFIGAAYGQRVAYISFLIANGIQVRVFGRGWDKHANIRAYWGGFLTHKDMLKVISQSKISLNFLWTSASAEQSVIKGRLMELAACRSFQMVSPAIDLEKNGFMDGEHLVVFHDQMELLDKIQYYLKHEDERDAVAQHAYEHVLEQHTWQQRFQGVFEQLADRSAESVCDAKQYQLVIVLEQGVQHEIHCEDERLLINILDSKQDWRSELDKADGVVYLAHDSSINNETLYMMAFGLCADQSDMIAANFYVGDDENRSWIRFKDRMLDKKPSLLSLLPRECFMFSPDYVSRYGCEPSQCIEHGHASYIEYPSFSLALPYFRARKLRFYFAHHRDPRKLLHHYVQSLHWGKALSLGIDKLWQKALYREGRE